MYANLELFIDGQWLNGNGRARRGRHQPGDGKAVARLPHASAADLDQDLEPPRKASRSGAPPRPTTGQKSCARQPI